MHRVLLAGGIYLNPGHARLREQGLEGRLRLLYEVNPLAFLVEQAGGIASDGTGRVMDVEPDTLHQRSPVVLGSSNEVELLLSSYV